MQAHTIQYTLYIYNDYNHLFKWLPLVTELPSKMWYVYNHFYKYIKKKKTNT